MAKTDKTAVCAVSAPLDVTHRAARPRGRHWGGVPRACRWKYVERRTSRGARRAGARTKKSWKVLKATEKIEARRFTVHLQYQSVKSRFLGSSWLNQPYSFAFPSKGFVC